MGICVNCKHHFLISDLNKWNEALEKKDEVPSEDDIPDIPDEENIFDDNEVEDDKDNEEQVYDDKNISTYENDIDDTDSEDKKEDTEEKDDETSEDNTQEETEGIDKDLEDPESNKEILYFRRVEHWRYPPHPFRLRKEKFPPPIVKPSDMEHLCSNPNNTRIDTIKGIESLRPCMLFNSFEECLFFEEVEGN